MSEIPPSSEKLSKLAIASVVIGVVTGMTPLLFMAQSHEAQQRAARNLGIIPWDQAKPATGGEPLLRAMQWQMSAVSLMTTMLLGDVVGLGLAAAAYRRPTKNKDLALLGACINTLGLLSGLFVVWCIIEL